MVGPRFGRSGKEACDDQTLACDSCRCGDAPGGRVRAAARDDSGIGARTERHRDESTAGGPRDPATSRGAHRRAGRYARAAGATGVRGDPGATRYPLRFLQVGHPAWGCEDARRERGVAEGERESTPARRGALRRARHQRIQRGARRPAREGRDELPRGPGRPGEPDHGHQLRRGAPAVHGAQRGVLEPEPPGAFSREAAVARRERSRRGDARRTGRLVERERCRFPVPSRVAAILAWVVAGLTLRWTMPWATHWFSWVLQTMCG